MNNIQLFEPDFFQDGFSFFDCGLLNIQPVEGIGGRALYCDQYLRCLDHAAYEDWQAFHCEKCGYELRGKIYFYYQEFEMIPPEDELDESIYNLSILSPLSFDNEESYGKQTDTLKVLKTGLNKQGA